MDHLDLAPIARMAGSVHLPGSKSISNRMLLLAALAQGDTTITGLLDADDIDRMRDALQTLGVTIEPVKTAHAGSAANAIEAIAAVDAIDAPDLIVRGVGADVFPVKQAKLFLGNAGTAFRPLTAALALAGGDYELTGVPRMYERPIGDLVDALRSLGADIRYAGNDRFPPLRIGRGAAAGAGRVAVRGDVSSQFLSALLMALPLLGREVSVEVVGELISRPYVELTLNLMRRFGVDVLHDGWERFDVPAGATYSSPGTLMVEGDASSASYFLAAGAIAGGPVRVIGAGRSSIQGDVRFADMLADMGARISAGDDWIEARGGERLRGIDADCRMIPDAAMTAAVVALYADGATTLRGIGSWRIKETDRIAAMATELRKVGARVDEGADWLRVEPPARFNPATIDTYDDHRMAMCFSLVSLGGVPVRINDPQCVRKTFPDYFAAFARLAQRA